MKCKSSNIQHENVGKWFEFLRQIPYVNIANFIFLAEDTVTFHFEQGWQRKVFTSIVSFSFQLSLKLSSRLVLKLSLRFVWREIDKILGSSSNAVSPSHALLGLGERQLKHVILAHTIPFSWLLAIRYKNCKLIFSLAWLKSHFKSWWTMDT